jgi:hypothetical protein
MVAVAYAADDLKVDDSLVGTFAPDASPSTNLGNVCVGTDANGDVRIAAENGTGSNVWANSATISLTGSASGANAGDVSVGSGSLTLPGNWESTTAGLFSNPTTVSFTVNSSTTGAKTANVFWDGTGNKAGGGSLTRSSSNVHVSWNVVTCAPSDSTAPDTGSITINDSASWTNSTSVTVDVAAHDATGVTRYRLAESQGGLASAADVAVLPGEVNFSREDVAFTLSTGDASAKSVWVRFCDAGDNCSDASDVIGLDTVKPIITGNTGSYVPGSWTNQSVTVSFTCADTAGSANSGIATDTVAGATLATSGADQSVTNSGTCTDNAGNVADAVTITDIDIDKVPPTVSCNAASFVLNEPGAQVSATVTDTLSGPVNGTESAAADTSSVGLKSVSITGLDIAGNSTTSSCSYTVGFNFDGLFAPIDKPNTMNVSKAGQAIPLKWRLTDYFGDPVTSLSSVQATVTGISCALGTSTDLVEEVAAGSSGLQNLGDGYYQFNWKTPTSYAGTCKQLNLNLGEGVVRTNLALINFKK